jgi:hypothetical protein
VFCPFYLKTGACRYGESCSRRHLVPDASRTLVARGMFAGSGLAGGLAGADDELDVRCPLCHVAVAVGCSG